MAPKLVASAAYEQALAYLKEQQALARKTLDTIRKKRKVCGES